MVGRVWPRHRHRGRPLNSVVRRHMRTPLPSYRLWLFSALVLALLNGCSSLPSDEGLRIEIEIRAASADALATGRTVGNEHIRDGGGFLRVRSEGPYVVAHESMRADRAKHRFVLVRDIDRSSNIEWVFLIDLPERVLWCSDWTDWAKGIPAVHDSSGLASRDLYTLINRGAPIVPVDSAPGRSLEARYRVNHFTGKCVERRSS
jgi:hypothetical protein